MRRRKFLQSSVLSAAAMSAGVSANASKAPAEKDFYELREYEIHFAGSGNVLENYFKNALIPALNRAGVKNVGVFKELGKSDPAKVYMLIPYSSMDNYAAIKESLKADATYQSASEEYNKIPADKPAYNRFSVSFLSAFDGHPHIVIPPNEQRIFEWRTYEGYSEDAVRRKIRMFHSGEFDIFNRVGLTSVFFSEMIAGKNMPCLSYMITFKDMEERDKNWAGFGNDPQWKTLSADPQFANSVSNIIRIFLEPTPYSQI